MGEAVGPLRHRRVPGTREQLDTVFGALARRTKLPTGRTNRPTDVLRRTGLPLLLATLVTAAPSAAAAQPPDGAGDPSPAPTGKPSAASTQQPWTVTRLSAASPRSAARDTPRARRQPPAAPDADPKPRLTYTVKPGDTVGEIARHTGCDVATIVALNHLDADAVIVPGRRLVLSDPTNAAEAGPVPTAHPGGGGPPSSVTAAAAANRAALTKAKVPDHDRVRVMVIAAARGRGVNPTLALAVASRESEFDQRRVSAANAIGVMQLTPAVGQWASTLVGRPLDLLDARDNITAGMVLLATLVRSAHDDAEAVAGYYQGLSSVRANGMHDDTRRYVADVQTLQTRFATTP